MKLLIFLIVLGVAEVFSIGKLHDAMGLSSLIGLYIVTTAIGGLFLYLQLPAFMDAMRSSRKLEKKFMKKSKASDFKPSAEEIAKFKPIIFISVYVPAAVLIAIPGILSDFIGTLMIIPIASNWLLEYKMNKAMKNAANQ
tara:strand:- start:113 stop:532 length:420 start_codon:yes stop_codon:yes gene_type:complete